MLKRNSENLSEFIPLLIYIPTSLSCFSFGISKNVFSILKGLKIFSLQYSSKPTPVTFSSIFPAIPIPVPYFMLVPASNNLGPLLKIEPFVLYPLRDKYNFFEAGRFFILLDVSITLEL